MKGRARVLCATAWLLVCLATPASAGTRWTEKVAAFAFERLVAMELALEDAEGVIVRARELATNGANDTNNQESRALLALEVAPLFDSLLEIANREHDGFPLFSSRPGPVFVASGGLTPDGPSPTVWFVGGRYEKTVRFGDSAPVPLTLSGRQLFAADDDGSIVPPLANEDLFESLISLHAALVANDRDRISATLDRLQCRLDTTRWLPRCQVPRTIVIQSFVELANALPDRALPACDALAAGVGRLRDAFADAASSSTPAQPTERHAVVGVAKELIHSVVDLRAALRVHSREDLEVRSSPDYLVPPPPRFFANAELDAWHRTLVGVVNEQHERGLGLRSPRSVPFWRPYPPFYIGFGSPLTLRLSRALDSACCGDPRNLAVAMTPWPGNAGDTENARRLADVLEVPTPHYRPGDSEGDPRGPTMTLIESAQRLGRLFEPLRACFPDTPKAG